MNEAIFITVEGMDGAGKTTAMQAIRDALRMNELFPTTMTREPGGTELNEDLRSVLLGEKTSKEKPSALTELLLMLGMRNHHIEKTIVPALRAGQHVVCSRYNDSTRVMQGILGGQGELLQNLSVMPQLRFMRVRPDVTFFIDIESEVANSRRVGFEDNFDQTYSHSARRPQMAWRSHFKSVEMACQARTPFSRLVRVDGSMSKEDVATDVFHKTLELVTSFRNRKPIERSYLDIIDCKLL